VNAAPTSALWLDVILGLALGGTAVVVPAALLARLPLSAAWQRTVWHVAMLGLTLLLVGELTGMPGSASALLNDFAAPDQPSTGQELDALVGGDDPPRAGDPEDVPTTPTVLLAPAHEPAIPQITASPEQFPDASADDGRQLGPIQQSQVQPAVEAKSTTVWWPGLLWLLGALAVAARTAAAQILLLVFRFTHHQLPPAALEGCVRAVAQRLGLRRRVRLRLASGLVGPVAFGIVRPTIALPAQFVDDFDPVQQEAMLAHELAHLAAHDPAWNLLADLVTISLWWHPLVWWANRRLRAASETAADDASLVVANGPRALATCLVALGARLVRQQPAAWVHVAGGGFRSGLGRRVERLVQLGPRTWNPPSRAAWTFALLIGPAVLAAAAFASTTWARSQASLKGDETMDNSAPSWRRSLTGIVLSSVLGLGAPEAQGDEPARGGQTSTPPSSASSASDGSKSQTAVPGSSAGKNPSTSGGFAGFSGGGFSGASFSGGFAGGGGFAGTSSSRGFGGGSSFTGRSSSSGFAGGSGFSGGSSSGGFALGGGFAGNSFSGFSGFSGGSSFSGFSGGGGFSGRPSQSGSTQPLGPTSGSGQDLFGGGKGGGNKKSPSGEPPVLKLKVYRLNHRAPQDLQLLLEGLLEETPGLPWGAVMGGGGGGMPGRGTMLPGGSGKMGPPGLSGGPRGGAGPGGGEGPATYISQGNTWRIVVDPRTRSLIVRAAESNQQRVADLVALLDVPAGKAIPKVKNLRAFKLRHAKVESLLEVLQQLGTNARLMGDAPANTLVAAGSEGDLKEIAEVVEALDVEVQSAPGDERRSKQ
jgi:beta-lactamase regulating signal transducer with metallopeptidase domain